MVSTPGLRAKLLRKLKRNPNNEAARQQVAKINREEGRSLVIPPKRKPRVIKRRGARARSKVGIEEPIRDPSGKITGFRTRSLRPSDIPEGLTPAQQREFGRTGKRPPPKGFASETLRMSLPADTGIESEEFSQSLPIQEFEKRSKAKARERLIEERKDRERKFIEKTIIESSSSFRPRRDSTFVSTSPSVFREVQPPKGQLRRETKRTTPAVIPTEVKTATDFESQLLTSRLRAGQRGTETSPFAVPIKTDTTQFSPLPAPPEQKPSLIKRATTRLVFEETETAGILPGQKKGVKFLESLQEKSVKAREKSFSVTKSNQSSFKRKALGAGVLVAAAVTERTAALGKRAITRPVTTASEFFVAGKVIGFFGAQTAKLFTGLNPLSAAKAGTGTFFVGTSAVFVGAQTVLSPTPAGKVTAIIGGAAETAAFGAGLRPKRLNLREVPISRFTTASGRDVIVPSTSEGRVPRPKPRDAIKVLPEGQATLTGRKAELIPGKTRGDLVLKKTVVNPITGQITTTRVVTGRFEGFAPFPREGKGFVDPFSSPSKSLAEPRKFLLIEKSTGKEFRVSGETVRTLGDVRNIETGELQFSLASVTGKRPERRTLQLPGDKSRQEPLIKPPTKTSTPLKVPPSLTRKGRAAAAARSTGGVVQSLKQTTDFDFNVSSVRPKFFKQVEKRGAQKLIPKTELKVGTRGKIVPLSRVRTATAQTRKSTSRVSESLRSSIRSEQRAIPSSIVKTNVRVGQEQKISQSVRQKSRVSQRLKVSQALVTPGIVPLPRGIGGGRPGPGDPLRPTTTLPPEGRFSFSKEKLRRRKTKFPKKRKSPKTFAPSVQALIFNIRESRTVKQPKVGGQFRLRPIKTRR